MEMLDNEFDIKVRSMLEDAAEEVPAGVWEGVSAALDKAAERKRRVIPVFWWSLTGGLAAAAAVVLAVILWPGRESDARLMADADQPSFAQVSSTDSAVEISAREPVSPAEPTAPVRSLRPSAVPAAAPETVRTEEEGASDKLQPVPVAEIPSGTSASADNVQQVTPLPEADKADIASPSGESDGGEGSGFASNPFTAPERIRQPRHFALTASGNAIAGIKTGSSSASSRSGIQRAPARFKAPTQTGVSQVGGTSLYGLPVTAGLGVRYYVTDRISLGTGCDYTFLFRRFSGTYNEVSASEGGSPQLIRSVTSDVIYNDQHYLGIPVILYYDFYKGNRLRSYVHGGGEIEKCVKSHYRVPAGSEVISFSEKVKGVQWSVGAGIGLEVKLSRHLGFYVDPSLRYYFKGNQPASLRTVQPLMVDVNAGFRFDIP